MRIGLLGCHRSGKTTLAKLLATRLNLETASSSVSGIAKEHSFDMDNEFRDNQLRFTMQQEIQRHLDHSGMTDFISDRTPLDAAAYQICDMRANSGSPEFQEAVLQYVDRAIAMTNENYDAVILVPPGIDFEPMDGKPGGNLAYQEHHHLVCAGLATELTIPNGMLERDNLDLVDRGKAVVQFLKDNGVI